ncbi:MAG: cell division protein ZapA [Tissierellia bacterium]|jgi:cell division protein ZapA|nr:cell division protein ZapA [Tissierellia bacterium]
MVNKKKINVVIDGRTFTVVGGDNERYIRNLAYYVDEKIKSLSSKNERLSQTMSATLAAFNIADEYHKAIDELNELKNKAKDPLEKYSHVLEELNLSNAKLEELDSLCSSYKEEAALKERQRDKVSKELHENLKKLKELSKEQEESEKLIVTLQDRNFQSQIELVETKKRLNEVLKMLDEETNMFKERKDKSEK